MKGEYKSLEEKRMMRDLSDNIVKQLLSLAKANDDEDWRMFSLFVVSGKRSSQVMTELNLSRRQILSKFKKYSKLLQFDLHPHAIRRWYALNLESLGIHPTIISKLLDHKLES